MNIETKRRFKARLFGEFARVGKALGSPHRLQLIDVLAQGERTVEQLAEDIGSPVANVSQHLQVLRAARLVSVRREGLYAHYSLADLQVFEVWRVLRGLARARLDEVDRVVAEYLGDRDRLEAVTADELLSLLRSGEVTVLDVRPRLEFEAGHIAGARSMPFDELARRLAELPAGVVVVAYCRGPYCVFADEAVALLTAKGIRAKRFTEGYPDWRSQGFPVETGRAAGRS